MSKDLERTKRKQSLFSQALSHLMSSINFLVTEDTRTVDERANPRIECRAEVAYVDERGVSGTGYLVDVSKSGLQLETPVKLARGLTLALNAPENENLEKTTPFMAQVKWSRKIEGETYRAGLALPKGTEDDPHWLESLLLQLGYTDDGSQRRRFIRSDSELGGELSPASDLESKTPVKVLNLGMGGALLRVESALPKNLQFRLQIGPFQDLPSVTVEGTILRVIDKPDEGFTLHPSRFNTSEERDAEILKEYVLKFSDRSGEVPCE